MGSEVLVALVAAWLLGNFVLGAIIVVRTRDRGRERAPRQTHVADLPHLPRGRVSLRSR